MKRVRLVICGVVFSLAACTDRDVEDWMIGVFSTRSPAPSDQFGVFERYRIAEEGELAHEHVDSGGVRASHPQTWEQNGKNAILIFPGPDDDAFTQEHYTWKLTREGRCGPYQFDHYIDGENQTPGGSSALVRGELCARQRTEPCDGECDCCVLYWCEPPPPCE